MATLTLEDKIKKTYEEHCGPLLEKREKLQSQLDEVDTELAKTEEGFYSAMQSLGLGKGLKGKKSKPAPSKSNATGKPKASDKEALAEITRLVGDNPQIAITELTSIVKDNLAAKGFESRGLKQRIESMARNSSALSVAGDDKVSLKA